MQLLTKKQMQFKESNAEKELNSEKIFSKENM
jgi:hypothetical protein